ncbi:MAG: tRNA (adenosine(37)-N6)-threonylcarbamoyltransferase complex dimerization subunit type 1 TsaB [Spirochaetaceae bacterium]|jgi:tRNA threonylcarbamoyladenosine biosynthesis protein TsaB|nr:tRNA (adenosine(37)-N6)-threonylcarbamoyltransferase complex dimerization subunit type 1 TsaB [Spirochaetaceae bacterium]
MGYTAVTIIALDTATAVLSVALVTRAFSPQKEQWYGEIHAGHRHGELLMEISDQLIKTAGIKPQDVDVVVCMQGPGSFTGLRIGFAAAKGLALALKIPFLTVPTLDCIAFSCSHWPGLVVPVLDAKKQCYFTAFYRKEQRLTEYMDVSPAKIAELMVQNSQKVPDNTLLERSILLTGPDGARIVPELRASLSSLAPEIQQWIRLDPWGTKGWGKELLALAQRKIQTGNGDPEYTLQIESEVLAGPLYLRKSDAELQWEGASSPIREGSVPSLS